MLSISPLSIDVAALRAAVAGFVVLPGEDGWDAARQAWNLAADQRPALVALPESAADVQVLVDFARTSGLRVAMQGTGHNACPMGPLDDTMLVKTERMRGVEIDERNCTARVEAGALWIDVTAPASEAGLAPLAGSSPDVGVVGYTLGGGLSATRTPSCSGRCAAAAGTSGRSSRSNSS
jgi:FAD/FMN-containing dehydrogenase